MKNHELFPLTRNLYFPGKQLVTRDMEAEQQYLNNKRRLINKLLHGCGIVCGLVVTVVEEDDAGTVPGGISVVVESGLALDAMGREIAVPEQIYLRLSDLDGFNEEARPDETLYLCIEYAQTPCEPMHSILDSAVSEAHYNRVEEGYRFYLTDTAAELQGASWRTLTGEERAAGYYDESLVTRMARGQSAPLCLARIHTIRWGAAYSIDRIDPVPFGQYVVGKDLLGAREEELERLVQELTQRFDRFPAMRPDRAESRSRADVRQGVTAISIPPNGKPGGVVFSDEIPHGLGLGSVSLSVGVVQGGGTVYGTRGIFDETGVYDYAVKTEEQKGTFCIGLRIPVGNRRERVVFSWLAVREAGTAMEVQPHPHLSVTPNLSRVFVREVILFRADVIGCESQTVQWEVRERGGGTIDATGRYRAPGEPGVYEVIARSAADPSLTASVFVVVQEENR